MDERTQLLVCLAAAVAANCIPCFDHYYGKALAGGLCQSEIDEAVALGGQIKQGSAIAMSNSVRKIVAQENGNDAKETGSEPDCCCT
jgi:alkylhydroperoxidase/carboxymuconolactone decarboxylase family protein YurZ